MSVNFPFTTGVNWSSLLHTTGVNWYKSSLKPLMSTGIKVPFYYWCQQEQKFPSTTGVNWSKSSLLPLVSTGNLVSMYFNHWYKRNLRNPFLPLV